MTDLTQLGKDAKKSAHALALMSTEQKNSLLKQMALTIKKKKSRRTIRSQPERFSTS